MADGTFKDGEGSSDSELDGRAIIPYKHQVITMQANASATPVWSIKDVRGVGLYFPVMAADTLFTLYVSPTNIPFGVANSQMTELNGITYQALLAIRTAFSEVFIGQHGFMQLRASVTQAAAYEIDLSGS